MYSVKDTYALPYVGSPIRISAGLWICAPHRSFSQLITSFFGSQCQGIPLMLLLTWPLTPAYALYAGFSPLLLVRFSLSSRRCRNVENLDLRRLCSFDFSEFLVSLNKLTSWNRRYTHFCAYLDSLSICLTFGVIQFSRYMTITQYWLLWWAWVDSNYRPHAYQACALTCWATGP